MRFTFNKRQFHRWMAWIIVLPLSVTTITGFLYQLLYTVGVQKESIKFLMSIHQMSILFINSQVIYTALLLILSMLLISFGYSMISSTQLFGYNNRQSIDSNINNSSNNESINNNIIVRYFRGIRNANTPREVHHRFSGVFFVILAYMAATGAIYRFLRNVFSVSKEKVRFLMLMHSMSFLPSWLSLLWVTFVFAVIAALTISGMRMLFKTKRAPSSTRSSRRGSTQSTASSPPTPHPYQRVSTPLLSSISIAEEQQEEETIEFKFKEERNTLDLD